MLNEFHKKNSNRSMGPAKSPHASKTGQIVQKNFTAVNFATLTSFKTKIQIGIVGTQDSMNYATFALYHWIILCAKL